jgi:hypothetical protein
MEMWQEVGLEVGREVEQGVPPRETSIEDLLMKRWRT